MRSLSSFKYKFLCFNLIFLKLRGSQTKVRKSFGPGGVSEQKRHGGGSPLKGRQKLGFFQSRWRRPRLRPCSCITKGLWRLEQACKTQSRLQLRLRELARKAAASNRKSEFLLTLCSGWTPF